MITKNTYVYDVEVAPNFFGVTFIPLKAYNEKHQKIIDIYIKTDMALRTAIKDNVDQSIIDTLANEKNILLKGMGAKIFNVSNILSNRNASVNQLLELSDFFSSRKILYGYNSNNYDKNMLAYVLKVSSHVGADGINYKTKQHICTDIYSVSQTCIDLGKDAYRYIPDIKYYKSNFDDYDIQKILYLDKTFVSLKFVAIILKWYRIQTLPYKYDQYLNTDQIEETNDYNVNDVLITRALIIDQLEEVELRKDLSEEFDANLYNLSRSSISSKLISKYYEYLSGIPYAKFKDLRTERYVIALGDILKDNIHFKTPELQDLLEKVKQFKVRVGSSNDKDKFNIKFIFKGTPYSMGLGGLHSEDDRRYFNSLEDGYVYRDEDVTSYYPNGILIVDTWPEHLDRRAFRATIGHIKDSRVEAKHIGKVKKAEGLKIAINAGYGKFRDRFSFLYDPKCTYSVTVNLQLYLIMLIEMLELTGKIHVISANTDGIVSKFLPEDEALFESIIKEWEAYTGFELEAAYYERYIRNDVNNYIAIKRGFKDALNTGDSLKDTLKNYVKYKGLFVEQLSFNKGYFAPIVAQALNKYFIFGVDYVTTIREHINSSEYAIYDYCVSQKSNKKFSMHIRTVVDGKITEYVTQNTNRFYVSNDKSTTIVKYNDDTSKYNSILTKVGISIFNDYEKRDDYNIDFSFYINECNKIIYGSEQSNKCTKSKKGMSAKNKQSINSGIIKPQLTLF